ncbi:MAG: O-antigen ligase family protein [Chloroflexota bacterium]
MMYAGMIREEYWDVTRFVLFAGALLPLIAAWLVAPLWVLATLICVIGALATLRFPLCGLVLLAFTVPWGSTVTATVGGFPLTPTEPIIALLASVLVVHAVVTRSHVSSMPWMPWVLLFVVAICLSATRSVDLHASEREIVKWLEVAVVYGAGCTFVRTRRDVHVVVAALTIGAVSQSLLGFFQSLLSAGPASFAAQHLFLRAYGTFDQPNPYAGYLNLVLPICVAIALVGGLSAVQSKLYWLSAITIAGAVFASESRAGLLAGLGGILVVLVVTYRTVLHGVLLGALALLCAVWSATIGLLPVAPVQRVLTSLGLGNITFNQVNDTNFSAVERAAHWLAGVRMFSAHPLLGVGIGNYGAAFLRYHPRGWYASLDHAHNYYINIAAEAGVIGLAGYALLAGSALWYGYAAVHARCEPFLRAVALGVLGSLVAVSLHNIFDVLYVHEITALLGLLMALTATCGAATAAGQSATRFSFSDVESVSPLTRGARELNA